MKLDTKVLLPALLNYYIIILNLTSTNSLWVSNEKNVRF